MYKCPKCKRALKSELELSIGIEHTIGYFVGLAIRVATTASARAPYWACTNRRCKYYYRRNIIKPFWLKINALNQPTPASPFELT